MVVISVIGIGAMGGSMARALLESDLITCVVGYDRNEELASAFLEESQDKGKSAEDAPASLSQAVADVQFVLLSLVNEAQCESVCFGGGGVTDGENLLSLLPAGTCVIMTSTVTATWAKAAAAKFEQAGILFLDCPVSGGPVRARNGELTLMASGSEESLECADKILRVLGTDESVHILTGGAGAGSTAKCVHQLLAGVHICAAAEAMAMAAKAGLDPQQMYKIVNGATGASWMFQDRGQRMIDPPSDGNVKSALDIFVKDLGIVHSEARALQSPIPIASAALQQFISGQSLGLGKMDDSQVVQVYERITGASVSKKADETSDDAEETS